MRLSRFIRSSQATAAVEFAFVAPALIMMIIGTFYAGIVMCSISSLHSAVETAARCFSVNSSRCSSASGTQAYALSQYYGTGLPTFTAANVSCGHQVSGSLTMTLSIGLASWAVPTSATACFP